MRLSIYLFSSLNYITYFDFECGNKNGRCFTWRAPLIFVTSVCLDHNLNLRKLFWNQGHVLVTGAHEHWSRKRCFEL